jgi:hypothetical protein
MDALPDERNVFLEARGLDIDADDGNAHGRNAMPGVVRDRRGRAADEILMLTVINGIALLSDNRQLIAQCIR